MSTCYLCEQHLGAFQHTSAKHVPLGMACSRCHQRIVMAGEDPAAINVGRAGLRLRRDMRRRLEKRSRG